MGLSEEYKELCKRVTELRVHLLPRTMSPIGDYSERQYDRASSFRLLCHSELEAYLEGRSRDLTLCAAKAWKKNGRASRVLLCLLAFSDANWAAPTKSVNDDKAASISDRINDAVRIHMARIEDNHGVREYNVLQLLVPVGLDYSQFDSAWLNSMDSFGVRRGLVAHTSKTTHQPVDPADELRTVRYLLEGIKPIDKQISSLFEAADA